MFKVEGSIYRASSSVGGGWLSRGIDGNWEPPTVETFVVWTLVKLNPKRLSGWTRTKRGWNRTGYEDGVQFWRTRLAFGRPWVWVEGVLVAKWSSREDPGFIAFDGPFLELKFPLSDLGMNPESPVHIKVGW